MSSEIKLSIVIPVLNSHEVVRRQLLHFVKVGLFDLISDEKVELILVDDGSDPPLLSEFASRPWVDIIETHDTRPWTWALARNAGARSAIGEYLLMTDLDYILSKDAIDSAIAFEGDKMRFIREFGILDENGIFTQDTAMLQQYGLSAERIKKRGVKMPPHPNNFVMRKDLFFDMGGYREDLFHKSYPQREDGFFKSKWKEWLEAGKVKDHVYRPTIYMFPNGQFCGDVDYNPFALFHDLSRKTDNNPWHKRILEGGHR